MLEIKYFQKGPFLNFFRVSSNKMTYFMKKVVFLSMYAYEIIN